MSIRGKTADMVVFSCNQTNGRIRWGKEVKRMSNLLVFAFLFFIGSCLGWGLEVFFRRFFSKNNPERKWVNPGFLTGPYLPIYGFGLWGMYFVSYLSEVAMTDNKVANTIIILVVMALVMTVIEYIAGIIFIKGMKVKLWDYSQERWNLQGIICPKFTLAWGLLGCFYFFVINPYVIDWVVWLSYHLTFSFFIGMFFGIFVIDVWYSMKLGSTIRKLAAEKDIVVKFEELKGYFHTQREEHKEKRRFLFAFKTEGSLRHNLESYIDTIVQDMVEQELEKLKHFKETVKEEMESKHQK